MGEIAAVRHRAMVADEWVVIAGAAEEGADVHRPGTPAGLDPSALIEPLR